MRVATEDLGGERGNRPWRYCRACTLTPMAQTFEQRWATAAGQPPCECNPGRSEQATNGSDSSAIGLEVFGSKAGSRQARPPVSVPSRLNENGHGNRSRSERSPPALGSVIKPAPRWLSPHVGAGESSTGYALRIEAGHGLQPTALGFAGSHRRESGNVLKASRAREQRPSHCAHEDHASAAVSLAFHGVVTALPVPGDVGTSNEKVRTESRAPPIREHPTQTRGRTTGCAQTTVVSPADTVLASLLW